MINPNDFAHASAYGVNALHPDDLAAALDSLRQERSALRARRPAPGPESHHFMSALSHLDAVIAEVEHAIEPTPDTAEELRRSRCRAAFDAYVSAFGCDPS